MPLHPFLLWINQIANRLMKASDAEPDEKAAGGGQDTDTIRELVAHSHAAGALDVEYFEPIDQAIALRTLAVGKVVRTNRPLTTVPVTAAAADIQVVAASSGHLRVLVGSGIDCCIAHVRDTLTTDPKTPAADIARALLVIGPDTSAYDALALMRHGRVQLAIVVVSDRLLGGITLDDILREVLHGPVTA